MPIGFFVDGAYLQNAFRTGKMNQLNLRRAIEAELNDTIDVAYYFAADADQVRGNSFYNFLQTPFPAGPGFRIKSGYLAQRKMYWPKAMGGGPVLHPDTGQQYVQTMQKGVDVQLVYYMVQSQLRRGWTKLVLAAGDGDFQLPVIELVEHSNVDLYLVGTADTISIELASYAKRIIEIDKEPLLSEILYSGTGYGQMGGFGGPGGPGSDMRDSRESRDMRTSSYIPQDQGYSRDPNSDY